MSPFIIDAWLSPLDKATLTEVIRRDQSSVHVTPDTCTRCDGGCDECLTCDRPGCKSRWHRRPR